MSAVREHLAAVPDFGPGPGMQAAIDAQREVGIRTAMGFLLVGDRGRAHMELVRSVLRQWRAACGGHLPIEPSRLPHERSTR